MVKYLCLWSIVTIRQSDCENRVVKYCETSLKSIKFGQSLVKLQSWFQDHLTWSNLVDQWGFKWVLGCREGKIPDLSQADISYYWVHKIQPITKHHVLLLGFTITTQKPIEICQVSCKNQSHLSTCKWWHKQPRTCKQWHKQSSACKRWHRRTNQVVTCVTNRTSPRVAHPPPNSYK